MLTYQYHCPTNRKTLEVRHGMKERLETWGELCRLAGIECDKTPEDAPVERVISGGILATVSGGTQSSASFNALPMARCCGNPAGCQRHA